MNYDKKNNTNKINKNKYGNNENYDIVNDIHDVINIITDKTDDDNYRILKKR